MRKLILALLALAGLLIHAPARADLATVPYQGVLSHNWLNGVEQSTDLVTDLRTYAGTSGATTNGTGNIGSVVLARGLASVGDGFGGVYYWNATSTASDDGANVIKPTAITGAGRWLRLRNVEIGDIASLGAGIAGALQSGNLVPTYASIAAFRAATTAWPTRHLQDYDGISFPFGGGDFDLVATGQPLPGQTASPDDMGCTTIVDNAGNEYERTEAREGIINVNWCGAGLGNSGPYAGNDSIPFAWAVDAVYLRGGSQISAIDLAGNFYTVSGLSESLPAGSTMSSGGTLTVNSPFTGVIQPSMQITVGSNIYSVTGFGTGRGSAGSYPTSCASACSGTPTLATLNAGLDMPAFVSFPVVGKNSSETVIAVKSNANIAVIKDEAGGTITGIRLVGDEVSNASYPALWITAPGTILNGGIWAEGGSHAILLDASANDSSAGTATLIADSAVGSSNFYDISGNWLYDLKIDQGLPAGMGAIVSEPAALPTSGSLTAGTPYTVRSTQASFNGYIAGYTLTPTSGTPIAGLPVHCSGCASGTIALVNPSGGWAVNNNQTVGSSGSPVAMTSDVDYILDVSTAGTAGGSLPTPPFTFNTPFAYGGAQLSFCCQWPFAAIQFDGAIVGAGETTIYKADASGPYTFSVWKSLNNSGAGGVSFNYLSMDYLISASPIEYDYGGADSLSHGHFGGGVIGPLYGGALEIDNSPELLAPLTINGGQGSLTGNLFAEGIVFGPAVTGWQGANNKTLGTVGVTFGTGDDYINWLGNDESGASTASSGTSNLGAHSNYGNNIGDPITIIRGTAALNCPTAATGTLQFKSGILIGAGSCS